MIRILKTVINAPTYVKNVKVNQTVAPNVSRDTMEEIQSLLVDVCLNSMNITMNLTVGHAISHVINA